MARVISATTNANFTKLSLHVSCCRRSVSFGGVAIRCVFPVLWITSYYRYYIIMRFVAHTTQEGCRLEVTHLVEAPGRGWVWCLRLLGCVEVACHITTVWTNNQLTPQYQGRRKCEFFGGRVSALFKVGVLNYRVRQISISKDFLSVLFNEWQL